MTTPVGTTVQYHSDPIEGYGGAVLPALLAASGPGPADDGALLVVFGTDGKVFARQGVLTRTTFLANGGAHGGSWGPVA